jgi:hypothetical protein
VQKKDEGRSEREDGTGREQVELDDEDDDDVRRLSLKIRLTVAKRRRVGGTGHGLNADQSDRLASWLTAL